MGLQVGPYCPFDDFRPSPTSPDRELDISLRRPNSKKVKMEDVLSDEFPFGGAQGPWLVSSGEDMQLNSTETSDNFPPGNWDEWMRWTPQAESSKPLNAQGPLCYLNPDNGSRLYNRRPNSLLQDPAQASTEQNEEGVPASASIAFTFGQAMENTPAFQISAPLTTPPVTADPQMPSAQATEWTAISNQTPNNNLVSPLSLDGRSQFPPPPLSTPSLGHSPESGHMQPTSSDDHSSPEPTIANNKKKRKSSLEDDASEKAIDKQQPVKKTAHNMIEKRYRTNLNDKIAALRDSVPSLRVMSRVGNGDDDDEAEDLEGLTPAHKLNKATVLSKATEYIRHLEKRNKRLQEEVTSLKARVDAYDKMALTGGPFAFQATMPTPDAARYDVDPFVRTPGRDPGQRPAQGMIPIPESISQLRHAAVNQPHYVHQDVFSAATPRSAPGLSQPVANGPRGRNGAMSKLMVGSLAGLMLMEGFASREQSGEGTEARGLFALPLPSLSKFVSSLNSPSVFGPNGFLPVLKTVLILIAFLYLIAPLFDFKPRPRGKSAAVRLAPAPSLALPVEVRRKAWLTAIQTVWVPQHSFLLEATALLLKTLKLSVRRLIGWSGYSLITGFTPEQEAARVKAWEIALDAQLTGGDAEISTNRLLLTLLASGTLPDTPARLMLKALHIRLMLWDMSKNGIRSWWLWTFNGLNLKIARSFWNAARDKQRLLKNLPSQLDGMEPLPEHLDALLELDCDDVLVDAIVQRAYNLAWNNPTAQDATMDETMDSVVEDFAISSPLDALASWWSSLVLGRVLVRSLETTAKSPPITESLQSDIEVAIRTAPPTSISYIRALTAKAVFSPSEPDIATALEALPCAPLTQPSIPSSRRTLLNLVQQSPVTNDVLETLTMAKCLSLASLADPRAKAMALTALNGYHPDETSFSLLSFAAGFRVLQRFADDEELLAPCKAGVERLAVALRVWVGGQKGRRAGLGNRRCRRVVARCLDVGKRLVGVAEKEEDDDDDDVDEGFVSGTEKGKGVDGGS